MSKETDQQAINEIECEYTEINKMSKNFILSEVPSRKKAWEKTKPFLILLLAVFIYGCNPIKPCECTKEIYEIDGEFTELIEVIDVDCRESQRTDAYDKDAIKYSTICE